MNAAAKLLLALTLSFHCGAALSAPVPPGGGSAPAPASGASRTTGSAIFPVVQRTLPNGLRVLVRTRRTAPVVTTMMWYRVGSRDELPGETGLAHFLEHLLFKGTRKLPKGAVDRITYQNGGSNNAFTFNDYTAYEFSFPKARWKTALAIEADRMRNCIFDRKEFEAERQVVMEERRSSEDDPEQQFGEQLNALTYLVHPYRNPVIGWMEDLKRVTRDEVYAFYRKYYVPANATLVITGDVTPEEALAAARSAFSGVPKLPAPRRKAVGEPPQIAARRLRLTLPTQVARYQVVFPLPARRSADTHALAVLDYALSEGRLSRLYRRLVEGDRLAADVETARGAYREAGELAIYANAREPGGLERIEAAVWDELRRVADEPLTAPELERAKNQIQADWIQGIETASELAEVLGEADAVGGHGYLETWLDRVRAVQAADVQRVARTYLRRDRSNTGYLYPREPASPAVGKRPETASRAGESGPERVRGRACRSVRARAEASPAARRAAERPLFPPLRPVEKVLPNGLRLILLENHDIPSVTLSARVDAGSNQETDAQAGLASLVARMLEEGTRSRDHEAISAALEQVGATFGAGALRATTTVSLQSLSAHLDRLLPLYAELLREPAFPADRLEQERSRVLVALKEAEDDAPTVARQAFEALIYGTHPAHRPIAGTQTTVRALERDALARFHARHYRPGNVTLVAVGDFSAPRLLERLTELFAGWKASGEEGPEPLPEVARQQEPRSRRIRMEKAQTQIVFGHLGVARENPDYVALRVMDTILGEGVGGGFTARIPYQLRDVQGLAYSVGSSITSTASKSPGVFIAALGTEPAKEKAAVAALVREIRRIRSEPVTEAELREAVDYLANSYVFGFQTHAQLAAYLQIVQYYGLGYDYRQRFPVEVRKVTRADVLRVAKKYLDPERHTLVVVGPEGSGGAPEPRR